MTSSQRHPRKQVTVGGISTTIYGDLSASREYAILFLLHGRFGHHHEPRHVEFAQQFLDAAVKEEGRKKELLVVTIDHRNHGERTVDAERNKGWKDRENDGKELDNPTHAIDMYAIQHGTARDITFLIDFLPHVLFPQNEQRISDYYLAGISLGGHSTWLALGLDRRITLGIPIIGSPSFPILMRHRLENLPLAVRELNPPVFHPTTVMEPPDPSDEIWIGRRILALCGEEDQLVPPVEGNTIAFVEALRQNGVDAVCDVEEGVGHTLSAAMAEKAVRFVLQKGLLA